MNTNKTEPLPVAMWGIAAGIAVLSIHGGVPYPEILQNYTLIQVPQPNSGLHISIAAIGGSVTLYHYIVSTKVGGLYQISFICGLCIALIATIVVNPSFTLIQRAGLVVSGIVGSVFTVILAN